MCENKVIRCIGSLYASTNNEGTWHGNNSVLCSPSSHTSFFSPHDRQEWARCRNAASFIFNNQTEQTTNRDQCALSPTCCLAQKTSYSTSDQICCSLTYKTDRRIYMTTRNLLQLFCVILPVNVQKKWWGCHPALPPQTLPPQRTHRNRYLEVVLSKQ